MHNAELFDAHNYGKFDEVLCLGIIYHVRYPQLTIDYLSTLETEKVVLSSQTHRCTGKEELGLFNRGDYTVWPIAKKVRNVGGLGFRGWHPTRKMLRKMLEWGGFTDIESLTDEDFDFPKKPREGLTNTSYYRARRGTTVDPMKACREFYG